MHSTSVQAHDCGTWLTLSCCSVLYNAASEAHSAGLHALQFFPKAWPGLQSAVGSFVGKIFLKAECRSVGLPEDMPPLHPASALPGPGN